MNDDVRRTVEVISMKEEVLKVTVEFIKEKLIYCEWARYVEARTGIRLPPRGQ